MRKRQLSQLVGLWWDTQEPNNHYSSKKEKIKFNTLIFETCIGREINIHTHSVPAIPVLVWVLSVPNERASPKSAILGLRFWSRRMLLVLMSLWMIFTSDPLWRYSKPSDIPIMMVNRCFQLNMWTVFFTAILKRR